MHCIIRGKFVISPCRKSALFWIRAVILLFRAEILPCGPPLLPHSCAEPFLGVVQKYSFLGDIYTSANVRLWFFGTQGLNWVLDVPRLSCWLAVLPPAEQPQPQSPSWLHKPLIVTNKPDLHHHQSQQHRTARYSRHLTPTHTHFSPHPMVSS